jgi:D-tyrosyl-tRNA(Tyr) deacylase
MKAIVQRVARASVRVGAEEVGAIGSGMLVLLGILEGDSEAEAQRFAEKIARFRFFPDEAGKMNRSALDVGGSVLVVSQFTLAADGRSGHRPSFDDAADPAIAEQLYERFVDAMRALGLDVETGRFGARMQVELVNDGPVTFALEEPPRAR